MQIRRTLPALGAGSAALALVALGAAPAAAHVTVTPSTTEAGAYTVLTFSVGHGCEGSPTTGLAISLPEEILQVTPTVDPGWTVEKVTEKLEEPVEDSHGNAITERVSQVVYEARTPLPDGFRDTVELSLQLPDAAGETLAFPVVQTCTEGETGWVETAAEGQDPDELEAPAPTVAVTAGGGGGDTHATEEPADDSATEATSSDEEDESGNALAIAALVAGVGGLALGGIALARSGRRG
ncbi:YcnI family copper-binding membrane protein [Nocardioides sp. SYSU DS0651]|uniref:YcnI family copper-binding membrane protein n=1 Tax=Nocardioides sp. SYSU DS0651 TaxID=3415955 RepID=UPI003F4CA1F9